MKSLFFALYRDLAGADELQLDLPDGATVADLTALIRDRTGADLPGAVVTAVNQEYASPETVLEDGDEVAYIPPVAGG